MKRISNMSEKIKIYYSPEAYKKTVYLVAAHSMEIGWNMVIKPYKDGYRVSDILVYPQKTYSSYIDVDNGKYGMWKGSLATEEDANLFGQGHSHVMMSTTPSPRDKTQQLDEIGHKGYGFFFFQIWNKKNEISSFFYDIDNDLMYDSSEIMMIVEEDEFIHDSREKLLIDTEMHFSERELELLESV